MEKKEVLILISSLKNGFSNRQIDELLGCDSKKTKGWKSWKILKKYGLKNEDKGKLFLYSLSDCKKIISKLENNKLDTILKKKSPSIVKKYNDSLVLAKTEEDFYQVMSGETRNIMKLLFNSLKKSTPSCQFRGCKKKDLDTVHLHKERPQIFKECAKKYRKREGEYYRYPIRKVMQRFLEKHKRKGAICFLCKKHHLELHRLKTKTAIRNFKKKIVLE